MGEIWILVPLAAMAIPIVAILSKNKGKLQKKDYIRLLDEVEYLKKENTSLKNRLENVETIVTEPNWGINKQLKEGNASKTPQIEE
ncbi:hypothetical protein [Flammeovirga pacifica]|uniref:Uncharacterized protein n=1 Tax=Flammeovirga pacifica TaxID=915059 RepID=A0A1S1Z3N5_FLAPC|nr:hypothetical protein [Flammeovirga pacifica]OHX67898.1 hypothetical protein NH26_16910 [Flammeovirga pacifica]